MSYTQRQIMLSFAYLAYTGENLAGIPSPDSTIGTDLATSMSSSANPPIPPIAGQWSLTWGPVSYTVPGSYFQDNMMYVAKLNGNSTPVQYVVAVRGTVGAAPLDWLMDDFDIFRMMPWPLGSPPSTTGPQIAESTSIALTTLLSMVDPNLKQTLLEFLNSEMTASGVSVASVCFTGHSLGATLASSLALYARQNQTAWDPNSIAVVTTANFAGPTAGNADFASLFDQVFDSSSSTTNADCVRNSLDVAPLAWNGTTLGQVENIYKGHLIHDIYAPLGTAEIIGAVISATSANNYTRIGNEQLLLQGTFIDASNLPPGLNNNAWVAEAMYQHHFAYPLLLNVPSLLGISPLARRVPRAYVAGLQS
jgi:hypothetical protein